MAQENIERLKAMYEAFSRQDFDAAIELVHPDVEFTRPGEGSIRGAEAVRAWMEPDALEGHTLEPLDFQVNGNKVLVQQRHKAQGAASGIDLEAETWAIFTFNDDGRATRVEGFLDRGAALEAAGLSE
jgi:ketosteroid isomerase-like protein